MLVYLQQKNFKQLQERGIPGDVQKMSYYALSKSLFVMKNIAFVLFPYTHLLDFAGPAQVFYEANQMEKVRFRIHYASIENEIRLEQGPLLTKGLTIQDLDLLPGDLICIPGVDFQKFREGKLGPAISKAQPWVRAQREKGILVGSICTGALILAEMGILDRIRFTTHWKCKDYVRSVYPKAKLVEERLYCFDRGIFTSAGMTAGIDMALALVEKWSNPLVAARVAREMVINIRRPETGDQKNVFLNFSNHFNAEVYRAMEILASRLSTGFTVEDLARELNISSRHLARLFKKHTGKTIQVYRNEVRLEHAEQLLLHSRQSIKEIAVACGFENARQFSRLWKTSRGFPPGRYRLKQVEKSG